MDMCNKKAKELLNTIDHTNLKPYATNNDFIKLCDEAKKYGFKMVAVNSAQVKLCRGLLNGTKVHVGAAIGFPLGQTTIEDKLFEAQNAINNGADEIDYVINIGKLKDKDYNYIQDEMYSIVSLCKKHGKTSKVIFENCYLTKDEIKKLCEIALIVLPDYIKTSTGFGTGGATIEDVTLMKSIVGDKIKVKAAGGIRTYSDFMAFIKAGASRIGTSAGVAIAQSLYNTEEN